MPNVIDNNWNPLNSAFSLNTFDGVAGLVLESWGPTTRNPQYNEALDTILGRLIALGVPYINIYLISAQLIKVFPDINDRAISIKGTCDISLLGAEAKSLRVDIGREQALLKVDKSKTGGNRTKRILLYNSNIDFSLWSDIAQGVDLFLEQISGPTCDRVDLERKVEALLSIGFPQPDGNRAPRKVLKNAESHERDPRVKAWVLKTSSGACEACDNPAPFVKENGDPYLEVHHVLPLSEDGSDTISNTIAVCPNCHMNLHYGKNKKAMRIEMLRKINRLINERGNQQ